MKIAVLGAGAMGSLFGGYLSQENEVWLIDVDPEKMDKINRDGITILESDGSSRHFQPQAVTDTAGLGTMDLIIIFVKAMHTRAALAAHRHLIGEKTYVMTLQNGAGHEDTLMEFVPREQIIIGTTQHNSSIAEPGKIRHGGGGKTSFGLLDGNIEKIQYIADTFSNCGFETAVSDNIRKQVWTKLFLNASSSVMTGVLQVKQGYLLDNEHAWSLVERLVREAVAVANAEGLDFEAEEIVTMVKTVIGNAREGYTSIYADLRDGRKTEVDTISGSVVKAAKRLGVAVPSHEFVVQLVHAIEGKKD